NFGNVLVVTVKVLCKESILPCCAHRDYEVVGQGGDNRNQRAERNSSGRNRDEHGQITWVPEKAIRPFNYGAMLRPFSLEVDRGREVRIYGHSPNLKPHPDRREAERHRFNLWP